MVAEAIGSDAPRIGDQRGGRGGKIWLEIDQDRLQQVVVALFDRNLGTRCRRALRARGGPAR